MLILVDVTVHWYNLRWVTHWTVIIFCFLFTLFRGYIQTNSKYHDRNKYQSSAQIFICWTSLLIKLNLFVVAVLQYFLSICFCVELSYLYGWLWLVDDVLPIEPVMIIELHFLGFVCRDYILRTALTICFKRNWESYSYTILLIEE